MTYEEATEYLFTRTTSFEKQGAAGYKEGLQTTLALDEHFEHPHHKFKTIHVAGTNGKGSTCHLLASILQSAGYRVGLFTSPHLVDFSERIRVDGEEIDHTYVVEWVKRWASINETSDDTSSLMRFQPSFFELATMLAFCYFADREVDEFAACYRSDLADYVFSLQAMLPLCNSNSNFPHRNRL